MRDCDYCGGKFEPRKMGKRQRFCPGGKCKKAFYRAAPEGYARVLKEHRERAGQDINERQRDTARPRTGGTVSKLPATEEERVNRAKDRAADAMAQYNESRRRELAAGTGAPALIPAQGS